MKNKFSKVILLLLSISLLISCTVVSSSAKDNVGKNGLVFNVDSDSATVTGYTGTSKKVTIPETFKGKKVTEIGNYAFSSKKEITSVSFPSTIKTIGVAAFNDCPSLTELVLPEKLSKIEDSAFWYCTGLQTIVLPSAVKSIGKDAFTGCFSLTVFVKQGSYAEKYASSNGLSIGYTYISGIKASSFSLTPGQTKAITASISPEIVLNPALKYSSDNKKVATVTSKGKVKAVSCGKAVITLTAKDGSKKTAKVTVMVVPAAVEGLKQTASQPTAIKAAWNASKGADGYTVYFFKTSANKWISLGTTTKTDCTISNLAPGSEAKIKIKAYKTIDNKNYYSAASKTLTATTAQPSTVKNVKGVSSTTDSIKLTWDKITGVTGYNVYKYNKSDKKYTLLGSTSSNSYTVKKLGANSGYVFAVKSYIANGDKINESKAYSSLAEYATCPTSTTLEFDKSTQTGTRLTVKWAEKKSVTGYELSFKASDSSTWTKTKISNTTQTSYTVNSLSPLTKYNFRIRTYTVRSYKTFYSPYSSVMNAETNNLPSDNSEAFDMFISAFNKFRNNPKESILLFTDVNSTDRHISLANSQCTSILDALPMNYEKQYNVEKGKVLGKNLVWTDLIAPDSKNTSIDRENVDVSFNYDGSGYRVVLTLPEENESALMTADFAPLPDWTRAGNGKTFNLDKIKYTGTTIEAKIQGDAITELSVSIPFEADVSIEENVYTLSEKINYNYFITYFN